eukprot:5130443-Amphidinium_carterae.1
MAVIAAAGRFLVEPLAEACSVLLCSLGRAAFFGVKTLDKPGPLRWGVAASAGEQLNRFLSGDWATPAATGGLASRLTREASRGGDVLLD